MSTLDVGAPRAPKPALREQLLTMLEGLAVKEEVLRLFESKTPLSVESLRAPMTLLGVSDRALVDRLLLRAGVLETVAPTGPAMRVVVRLGYPGDTYASVARALDAELGPRGLAERAHDLLDAHGRAICRPVGPACNECRLAERCDYRGRGLDPARRLRLEVLETP